VHQRWFNVPYIFLQLRGTAEFEGLLTRAGIPKGKLMLMKQESSNSRLAELLVQAIVDAENDDFSVEAGYECVLFSWQTKYASYQIMRRMNFPDEQSKNLSRREKQIIQLIMQGVSNKGIAHILDISPNTVSTYIRRVYTKLDVCTRAEMVSYVLHHNLL
jgi:DNA-binding NarL/FixJ family response regulator